MKRRRKSPRPSPGMINALALAAYLDNISEVVADGSPERKRTVINGVHVDPTMRRIIRRYRNGHVKYIRPATVGRVLAKFNLTYTDFYTWSTT